MFTSVKSALLGTPPIWSLKISPISNTVLLLRISNIAASSAPFEYLVLSATSNTSGVTVR